MKLRAASFFTVIVLATACVLLSFKNQNPFDLKASITRGKEVYNTYCVTCHMDEGQGLEGVFPPLAKADYLMADTKRSIQQILYGANIEMKVNGVTYNAEMVAIDLKDDETSDVLNYVRNSFGNNGKAVKPEDVKAARKKIPE